MNLWKVRVDCYYRHPDGDKPVRETRYVVIEAADSLAAPTEAAKYAERSASFGPRWVDFQARSWVRIKPPFDMRVGGE